MSFIYSSVETYKDRLLYLIVTNVFNAMHLGDDRNVENFDMDTFGEFVMKSLSSMKTLPLEFIFIPT